MMVGEDKATESDDSEPAATPTEAPPRKENGEALQFAARHIFGWLESGRSEVRSSIGELTSVGSVLAGRLVDAYVRDPRSGR